MKISYDRAKVLFSRGIVIDDDGRGTVAINLSATGMAWFLNYRYDRDLHRLPISGTMLTDMADYKLRHWMDCVISHVKLEGYRDQGSKYGTTLIYLIGTPPKQFSALSPSRNVPQCIELSECLPDFKSRKDIIINLRLSDQEHDCLLQGKVIRLRRDSADA